MSICIALIYFGMVKVSLVFSAPQNAFTLFWPANGFLLGVLIVKGFKRLGFAVLLSFLFLISANFFSGKGIAASIGFTLANMAEIASAYFLLTRIRTEKPFLLDPKLTIYFLIVTTFAAALVGGLIGGATVSICFGGGMVGHVVDWVLVDAMGMAVITPAIVAWMSPDCAWNKGRARTLEFLLCFLTISLLCYFIFWNSSIFSSMEIAPKPYLIFPLLLWSAMRFGPRGTATNLLALYGITAWFTIRGAGPFYEVGESQRYMLLTMEPFPFAAALCSLVPAAFIASQIELTRMVRMRDSRFGGLWNSKLIGIYESDLKGQILEANDTFLKMIDRDRSALQNGEIEMFKMATPEYQAGIAQKMELFRATGSIGPMEREWVLKDGKRFFSLVYGSLSEDKTKALVMVLDMTQLREAKSDLHAVESRFKNMFDSNIVGSTRSGRARNGRALRRAARRCPGARRRAARGSAR